MTIEIKNKTGDILHTVTSDTLYGVDLSGLNLTGADLRNVGLPYANFDGSILVDVDFEKSNLGNATLVGANLTNSNWIDTNTLGADFTNSYLTSNTHQLVKVSSSGLSEEELEKETILFDEWIEIPIPPIVENENILTLEGNELTLNGVLLQLSSP